MDRLQSRLAASTLGGVWRLLRSVFTAAHNEGLLLRNPCQKIKIPKAGRRAPRVLTVPEQARLEQAAAEADEIEYLLCLYTGLRVGDDDDKIRLNQRKPSKYKGLRRFGPEKNLQRINKFCLLYTSQLFNCLASLLTPTVTSPERLEINVAVTSSVQPKNS